MEKYSCFNCPTISDYSLKELHQQCANCNMEYGFPLDCFPEFIGDIAIKKSLARGFYGATYIGEVKFFNSTLKKVIKVIPVNLYALNNKSFSDECGIHLELSQNSNHVVQIDPTIYHESIPIKFTNGVTIECHVIGMEYLEGITLKEFLSTNSIIPARTIAQIAIDLITLLQELRTNEKYHNDLHPGNIIIEKLPNVRKRFNEIDEDVKVVAIDLGSLNQKTKSNDESDRTGDLHWVAMCLNSLSRKITDHPDLYDEKDWRLAFLLEEKADFLKPEIIHQRQITYKDLINQIRDTYHQHTNPWQQELVLKSFDDAVNAQSLSPWHVSSLFVDKDNVWTNSISIKGPQVITGMRGCGKTMLLRSLEFHARLMPQNTNEKSIPLKIIERITNASERYLGLYISCVKLLDFNALQKDEYKEIFERLSEVLRVLFEAAALCIDTLRTFQLVVLSILGPLVFGIAVFDGFQHTLTVWLARYINIYLWLPVANIFGSIIGKIQELMLKLDLSQVQATGDTFFSRTDMSYLIFMIIGIIGYFTVPSVANYIVHAGGGGALGHKVTSMFGSSANSVVRTSSNAVGMAADAMGDADRRMTSSMAATAGSSPYFQDKGNYMNDRLKGNFK